MRHRAVLFGLQGTFLIYAGFQAHLQLLALVSGFVSVLSVLWLAQAVGHYGKALRKVVVADVAAALCLRIAAVLYALRGA